LQRTANDLSAELQESAQIREKVLFLFN